jgi:hypothetical protein
MRSILSIAPPGVSDFFGVIVPQIYPGYALAPFHIAGEKPKKRMDIGFDWRAAACELRLQSVA